MSRLSLIILVISLGSGCAKDPSQSVPQAQVNTPEPIPKTDTQKSKETPTKEIQATEQSIALDGEISFIGSKVTGSNTGRFNSWIGTAMISAKGELNSLSLVVQTKDVEANFEAPTKWSKKLEAHLRDDDFFASAKHPTATFQLDKVTPIEGANDAATHTLGGRLTIRGTTKTINFPATISSVKPFAARAEFSINRKDFGMMYDGKADNLIRDGVVMKITLKAKS